MTKFSRRKFTTGLAAGSAILAAPSIAFGARARVVVVGGGAHDARIISGVSLFSSSLFSIALGPQSSL